MFGVGEKRKEDRAERDSGDGGFGFGEQVDQRGG